MHISEYDELKAKLNEVKEYSNFIPDASTKEGYEKSKRVSLDIGKIKTSLEKVRKDKKSYFLEGGKQVDSQAKEISKELDAMQLPHMAAYKELDNLKKEREKERVSLLEDRVSSIRNLPEMMIDSCSDEIKAAMNQMENEDCENFYEFMPQALKARNEAQKQLADLLVKTLRAEKDAAELLELRKKQAEQEQKERDEAIAKQASAKTEKEKQDAIEREEAQRQAKIQAEKDTIAAHERAREIQKQAEINAKIAERNAEEQANKQAVAAENRRLADVEAAKNAEIARQQEEQKKQHQEALAREANTVHKAKINNAILSTLVDNGISMEYAKAMITMIARNQLPHVTINY